MFKAVKPNSQITKILSEIVKTSQRQWVKKITYRKFSEQEFLERPIPSKDIPASFSGIPIQGYESLLGDCCKLLGAKKVTNSIYYPPNAMLPWHTNSDLEGVRTYYTFSMEGGMFRYYDSETGEFINAYDNKGWNVNTFEIVKDKPFWHTVWAKGSRFSFGFLS